MNWTEQYYNPLALMDSNNNNDNIGLEMGWTVFIWSCR